MLLGDKLQNIIVKQGEGAAPIKKRRMRRFLLTAYHDLLTGSAWVTR